MKYRKCLLIISMLLMFVMLGASAQAKVTVEVWTVWGQASVDLINEALAPFLAKNPDIELNLVPVAQGVAQRDKLYTMMAAGTPPDIVFMVTPLAEVAMQGALTPLDSLIATSKTIRAKDYPPGMLEMFKVDGATYGIPGIEAGPWNGLVINADLLEASGVAGKAPATLDELFKVGRKVTRMDGDKITQIGWYPMAGMPQSYFPESWPFLFDQTLYDPVKKVVNINTPVMRDMLTYMASFHDAIPALAVEAWAKLNGGAQWGNMLNGTMGIQYQGYWAPGRLVTAGTTEKWRFTYGWMPNVKNDKLQVLGGWGMVIPKGAPHVKEAFKVIEAMVTPEAGSLFFERNGWLNGNLVTMRQLNVRNNPGAQWYIQSLSEANRVKFAENNPIARDMRSVLTPKAWTVMRGTSSPEQALADAQAQLQSLLDSVVKK